VREAYIVEAVRTPVGRGKPDGALRPIHPVKLLAQVLDEVCRRAGVEKGQIEDIIAGCVSPINEQGANIARLALLQAGFPFEVPGVQINRMCGSSQQAVHFAAQEVITEDKDLAIGAGIEMMGTVPMGSDWGVLSEDFLSEFPYELRPMGVCAEDIADEWGLSREELDAFSVESHLRAARAWENGYFDHEVMPVEVPADGGTKRITRDEGFRPNATLEAMAGLRTPFKENGKVTAGNASQISDGAAAVLVASCAAADRLGLRKRARIVGRVAVGSDPRLTLSGPIPATHKVLEKTGLKMEDIDVFEVNEAFASVVLAWAKDLKADMSKVNPNGGAIALGHPLGATGGILMTKMLHELERTGGRYGLQTMCIGHGMATATIIERVG
jgi:acetyl-CoA C-acetyltransferase/acetyl-CoA acyltransferase